MHLEQSQPSQVVLESVDGDLPRNSRNERGVRHALQVLTHRQGGLVNVLSPFNLYSMTPPAPMECSEVIRWDANNFDIRGRLVIIYQAKIKSRLHFSSRIQAQGPCTTNIEFQPHISRITTVYIIQLPAVHKQPERESSR